MHAARATTLMRAVPASAGLVAALTIAAYALAREPAAALAYAGLAALFLGSLAFMGGIGTLHDWEQMYVTSAMGRGWGFREAVPGGFAGWRFGLATMAMGAVLFVGGVVLTP